MDKPAKEPAFPDKQEAAFRNPPQWIHESVAARFFAPLARRRDARRRAILALIDSIKNRGQTPISATLPSSPPSAVRRSRS
ncbi:MAG TPA: hypothetical protein VFZ74_08590 [Burkholderiales bacterium]